MAVVVVVQHLSTRNLKQSCIFCIILLLVLVFAEKRLIAVFFETIGIYYYVYNKNPTASRPSEHPPVRNRQEIINHSLQHQCQNTHMRVMYTGRSE